MLHSAEFFLQELRAMQSNLISIENIFLTKTPRYVALRGKACGKPQITRKNQLVYFYLPFVWGI
jgi:hypothetical protein